MRIATPGVRSAVPPPGTSVSARPRRSTPGQRAVRKHRDACFTRKNAAVTSAAIRLPFRPDEYLCMWWIPDGKGRRIALPGSVDLAAARPPSGAIHGPMPVESLPSEDGTSLRTAFPQTVRRPAVEADLANGGQLILLDATIEYLFGGNGWVHGSAALVTGGSPARVLGVREHERERASDDVTPPTFSGIELQVTAIDAVSGFAPIAKTSNQAQGASPTTYSATLRESTALRWEREDQTLRIEYAGRLRVLSAYEYQLAFAAYVGVELPEPISVDACVDNWLEPVRRIVSVATGRQEHVTSLMLLTNAAEAQQPGRWQVFGAGIHQDPYNSSEEGLRDVKSALACAPDDVSLLDLVIAWQGAEADHNPLIETYGSMVTLEGEHPRSRYLLLVQAIEGMHGHESRAGLDARNERFAAQRMELLERVEKQISPDDLRFLRDRLPKRAPSGLDGVLLSIVRDLPTDPVPQLTRHPLVTRVMDQDPRAQRTWYGALRTIRNDLAHGNRGYEAEELHGLVQILERIVRAHFLRILGCPEVAQQRALTG